MVGILSWDVTHIYNLLSRSGKLDQLQWTDDGQILSISTVDGKYHDGNFLFKMFERNMCNCKCSLRFYVQLV